MSKNKSTPLLASELGGSVAASTAINGDAAIASRPSPPSKEFHVAMKWAIVAQKVAAFLHERFVFCVGVLAVFLWASAYYVAMALAKQPNPELLALVTAHCKQVSGGIGPSVCTNTQLVVDDQRYDCIQSAPPVTIPTSFVRSVLASMAPASRWAFPIVAPYIALNWWKYGKTYDPFSSTLIPTPEVSYVQALSIPFFTLMLGAYTYILGQGYTSCFTFPAASTQADFIINIVTACTMGIFVIKQVIAVVHIALALRPLQAAYDAPLMETIVTSRFFIENYLKEYQVSNGGQGSRV